MNHFNRFKQNLAIQTMLAIVLPGAVGIAALIIAREQLGFELVPATIIAGSVFIISASLAQYRLFKTSIKPLEMIWQAVWHVSPDKSSVPPPNLQTIKVGRELVSAIVGQVYDLASSAPIVRSDAAAPVAEATSSPSPKLVELLPLPVLVLDKNWNIACINDVACTYLGRKRDDVMNKGINDVLHMSFQGEDTFDAWLKSSSENRAIDTRSWEQVKLATTDGENKKFDLAASYSKDNSEGHEVVLVLFDKSKAYNVQEQATSYVAMAVHELRTPLTMLRGYIELFEDELGDQLSPEHQEFMRKMSVAAQNLAAFVSNILNVARIDEDQFVLSLHEADWKEVLTEIVQSLELRAQVKGKRIHLEVADELPKVGIDKISMYEVVNNLVDNAIKYSGQSPDITIKAAVGKEGLIETTVTDHGAGMPQNVLSGLFTKFYRSHRSKNAVSGSGLGLYLVKTIVTAHGGNVWVQSKEGEGSTFGFSIVPFDQIDDKDKTSGSDGIERQASGWIKNHSLYRR